MASRSEVHGTEEQRWAPTCKRACRTFEKSSKTPLLPHLPPILTITLSCNSHPAPPLSGECHCASNKGALKHDCPNGD
jgi:hypothetical protein